MKIKVILADDHPVLIAGILHELSGIHTIDVVGTAFTTTALIDLLARVHCDVLVTDYVMPGGAYGDGMTLLSLLRRHYPQLYLVNAPEISPSPTGAVSITVRFRCSLSNTLRDCSSARPR